MNPIETTELFIEFLNANNLAKKGINFKDKSVIYCFKDDEKEYSFSDLSTAFGGFCDGWQGNPRKMSRLEIDFSIDNINKYIDKEISSRQILKTSLRSKKLCEIDIKMSQEVIYNLEYKLGLSKNNLNK